MRAFSTLCGVALVCGGLMVELCPAQPFPLPVPQATNLIPQRVAQADLVVLGKVTAIANDRVAASSFPRQTGIKMAFKVATIKAGDVLLGPKKKVEARVGFLPEPDLVVGQEACFLLMQHPEQDFYVPVVDKVAGCPPACVFIDKNVPDQQALVKRCAALLADPMAGLQAKDADDRFITASMLVVRYRSYRGAGGWPPREPIDAKESKLILEALRDADWRKAYPETWLTPSAVFNTLGLPPETYNPSNAGATPQTWLKANATTYRIERFAQKK